MGAFHCIRFPVVNLTEECVLLSVSQKLDAVSILGTMASVSSTHLRQKEGGSEPQLCQKLHLILLIKFYNTKKIHRAVF